MKKTVELVSPYPVEECKRRLEAQMHRSMPILSLAETRPVPVIGRIRGTRLRARRGIWYRNPFQTYLSAELIAAGSKSRIHFRFSTHPLVKVSMTLWFSGVVLIGGFGFVDALHRDIARALAVAVPIMLMLIFGFALVRFGRYLARDEQQFLADFIREILNAKRI